MSNQKNPLKTMHDWLLAHDKDVEKRYKIAEADNADHKEIKSYWIALALVPLFATIILSLIALLLFF